jgi:hypothetical protein
MFCLTLLIAVRLCLFSECGKDISRAIHSFFRSNIAENDFFSRPFPLFPEMLFRIDVSEDCPDKG